ncbi:hypothetical protein NXO48_000394 [Enterococcus faecalis]|jgi:hypothetical protein|uniref:hypothetical protein n=1 Tax=Enterococcus TaxID=1350 RepID=UPI000330A45A|nr:hypothetical protein [Enterococcus faecalis]EGO2730816.1 hypothetical protein [Enterococcus faecalis]EJB2780441.1 hypothetical protein [Enterococcus faecalis]EJR6290795.1 hypothetical protein [Enterococcus faecalis]EKZ0421337.1 hypothetical protein [Enterococcus faecalis]EOF24092.1 hypothetical protein SC5_02500 [Enterococcus faecalis EnGen0086]
MVYVKKTQTYQDINFLKSEKFISFTKQVDETTEGVVEGVLPAGSVFPKNDATAEGITINDVDVSNGPQPVGVIVEGHVLIKRLPVEPSSEAQKAMREVKFYDANGKMLAVPTA